MRANTEAGESGAAMAGAAADVPGYRPVSPWAVATLGLGILSGVALVSPVFLVVPLVAIAVAVAALRDVGREGVRKAGRLVALGGLALAAGFAGQALTAQLTARSLAAARCAAAAEIFLAAIREGRIDDAVSMCAPEAGDAARKIEACRSVGRRCRAHPGDEPGTWIVRVVPADPVDCDVRLVLVPTPSVHRRAPVERWLVTACEVTSPAAVRPSVR